MRSCC